MTRIILAVAIVMASISFSHAANADESCGASLLGRLLAFKTETVGYLHEDKCEVAEVAPSSDETEEEVTDRTDEFNNFINVLNTSSYLELNRLIADMNLNLEEANTLQSRITANFDDFTVGMCNYNGARGRKWVADYNLFLGGYMTECRPL